MPFRIGTGIHFFDDASRQGVEFEIPGFDHIGAILPEHMLDAIERIEHTGQHTFFVSIQLGHENPFALVVDAITQIQELGIINKALFQCSGILRPAQGQKSALVLPDVFQHLRINLNFFLSF